MKWTVTVALLVGLTGCSETTAPPPPAAAPSQQSSAVTGTIEPGTTTVSTDGQTESPSAATSSDWRQWRGPNRNGIAADGQTPPTSWSDSENVIWKTKVPGRGHSSPTVVGDRIFLQSADEQDQVQFVLAFDRNTGDQIWKTDVSQGGFPKTHNKNTHASPTVACNGTTLFASFVHHDAVHLYAFDLDGNEVWKQELGPFAPKSYQYGYAPSPTLYGSTVIVAADTDTGGFITARSQTDGTEVWTTERPGELSYSSPIITTIAGKDQLLISGGYKVRSYDPATGTENWSVAGATMATCGTMVWDGSMVFASGGYPKSETVGVRADTGQVVWRNGQKCYEQSMLAFGGHLYAVTDRSIAYCWDARTGDEKWKGRLSGSVSASPILAGGNIYLSNEDGTTYVFKGSSESFELIAENQLGDEAFATPTFCGNQIYLRVADSSGGSRQEYLYCVGE